MDIRSKTYGERSVNTIAHPITEAAEVLPFIEGIHKLFKLKKQYKIRVLDHSCIG